MKKVIFASVIAPVVLCAGLLFAASAVGDELAEDDFLVISGPTSPRVAYALRRDKKQLRVIVDAETFARDASDASVTLGLFAARKIVVGDDRADVKRSAGKARFIFSIPLGRLINGPKDLSSLRMAWSVRWKGGALGADRLRMRFGHLDTAAPHAPLASDPNLWRPVDIKEYEAIVADRRDRIAIGIDQPSDGKATVVVEDIAGNRVRNLVSGAGMLKGRREVLWDGLDEDSRLVAPGKYRWRSIHHKGIAPEYLFSFCNGGETFLKPFGSNHGHFTQATTNGKYVFFGAALTEGGYALIACDPSGKWRHGYKQIHGTGIGHVAIAADDKYFYAAHDGPAWGQRIDRKKPGWKGDVKITLTRFEIETGRPVAFGKGSHQFEAIEAYQWGPGAKSPNCRKNLSLTSMAYAGGKLYVGAGSAQAILVVDPATAKVVSKIDLASPGALTAGAEAIWAAGRDGIVRINLADRKAATIIPTGDLQPSGLAVDADGRLYVSDAATHTVKAFDAKGKQRGAFGKSGGEYQGRYDPERMVKPGGLVVVGGRLWVTERRVNPKRVLAWDLAGGKVVAQKFGCPPYGGPMASFDPLDHTSWLGLGGRWRLNFTTKKAQCTSIMQASGGHIGGYYPWCIRYRFVRTGGRTFLVGMGMATLVSELKDDGTLKDMAMFSSCHHFSYGCHWKPPRAYINAFNKQFPDKVGKHSDKGPGVMWLDANGDGLCQAGEFNFTTKAKHFAGSAWGHAQHDLNLQFPVTLADGRRGIVAVKPDGLAKSGVPNYPKLDEATTRAVLLKKEIPAYDYKSIHVATAVDRFGNVVFNTDPQMVCYSPDGRLRWQYPNNWVGVHGSHRAPLPEVGQLQGALFFLGVAPFDDKGDVFMMNGNHGRFFVMTSDGMYLDEMFKDVRMGGARDATYIGGEAFGGSFGMSEKDGEYYLQTGGDGYRIYRVGGLKQIKRDGGELKVTDRQILAAERKLARRSAGKGAAADAVVARRGGTIKIDGQGRDWPKAVTLGWDRNGRFPAKVKAVWDDENLYLFYEVQDPSPWVNNGKDWTTLFKTGDSIDLQLGTDAGAPAKRRAPVAGDLRLLIAPFEGKPLAVLYRHRVSGARNPVTFTCPWRSEKVDVVRKVTAARIAVQARGDRYSVEAMIPLSELGLKNPASGARKADFGVIYGDRDGTINMLRSYWANQVTMLVNDVPGEIMLHPDRWGVIRFEGRKE